MRIAILLLFALSAFGQLPKTSIPTSPSSATGWTDDGTDITAAAGRSVKIGTTVLGSLTYSSGTSDPATCTPQFPPGNGSYFYRTDLRQWKFCNTSNSWETVSAPDTTLAGLGGTYMFGGPVSIGNEGYVENPPDVAALTVKHTGQETSGHAIGISNTRVWAPSGNAGGWSAAALDNLFYIVGPGPAMTVPYFTGQADDLQILGSGVTVTNLTGASVKSPTLNGNAVTNAYALRLEDMCLAGVTNCYALYTGTGKNYLKDSTTQEGAVNYASDSGSANAYVVTLTPPISAYVAGACYSFAAGAANTGAATLNVNGRGAKTIKHAGGRDLASGEILAGQIVTACYDGTNMQLHSASPASNDLTTLRLRDEFVGGFPSSTVIGELGWTAVNHAGTGAISTTASVANHPGILNVASGATLADSTGIYLTGGADTSGPFDVAGWYQDYIFRFSSITDVSLFVGCGAAASAGSLANAVGLRFDTSAGDGTMKYRSCKASTCSVVDSSLTPVANTWYRLHLESTTAGTVTFLINGSNAQSIAANVPAVALSCGFEIGTQTGTSKNLDADAFQMMQSGLSR